MPEAEYAKARCYGADPTSGEQPGWRCVFYGGEHAFVKRSSGAEVAVKEHACEEKERA